MIYKPMVVHRLVVSLKPLPGYSLVVGCSLAAGNCLLGIRLFSIRLLGICILSIRPLSLDEHCRISSRICFLIEKLQRFRIYDTGHRKAVLRLKDPYRVFSLGHKYPFRLTRIETQFSKHRLDIYDKGAFVAPFKPKWPLKQC